jgi:hypothetical protein
MPKLNQWNHHFREGCIGQWLANHPRNSPVFHPRGTSTFTLPSPNMPEGLGDAWPRISDEMPWRQPIPARRTPAPAGVEPARFHRGAGNREGRAHTRIPKSDTRVLESSKRDGQFLPAHAHRFQGRGIRPGVRHPEPGPGLPGRDPTFQTGRWPSGLGHGIPAPRLLASHRAPASAWPRPSPAQTGHPSGGTAPIRPRIVGSTGSGPRTKPPSGGAAPILPDRTPARPSWDSRSMAPHTFPREQAGRPLGRPHYGAPGGKFMRLQADRASGYNGRRPKSTTRVRRPARRSSRCRCRSRWRSSCPRRRWPMENARVEAVAAVRGCPIAQGGTHPPGAGLDSIKTAMDAVWRGSSPRQDRFHGEAHRVRDRVAHKPEAPQPTRMPPDIRRVRWIRPSFLDEALPHLSA